MLRDTHNRRDFFWLVIDGLVAKDDAGWMFWMRTPLFGLWFEKNWIQVLYTDERRRTKIWFGFVVRWPSSDGDIMYRWHWEHYFGQRTDRTGAAREIKAHE
jgi:hypothetical protein